MVVGRGDREIGEPKRSLGGRSREILLVGDVPIPFGLGAVVVDFYQAEVSHKVIGAGAMPVPFTSFDDDGVASSDLTDRATLRLYTPNAFGDVEDLAVRVPVPRRPRGRREVHAVGP